jgi:hypothetical protein
MSPQMKKAAPRGGFFMLLNHRLTSAGAEERAMHLEPW